MKILRSAVGAAALLASVPAIAADCAVERPADGDLKAFADRYFPAAGPMEIDALIACLADPTLRCATILPSRSGPKAA